MKTILNINWDAEQRRELIDVKSSEDTEEELETYLVTCVRQNLHIYFSFSVLEVVYAKLVTEASYSLFCFENRHRSIHTKLMTIGKVKIVFI